MGGESNQHDQTTQLTCTYPKPHRPPLAGLTIGHVLRCHPKPERWKLKMYVPMLICFFLGAAAGTSAFAKYGRSSLLLPTFFLFVLGWGYIYFLARTRKQPFHRVLLKRVSNEILTPHSPSNKNNNKHSRMMMPQMPHMPHMPHMPQINIPFTQGHGQQQRASGRSSQPHHGRRHSSACDKLGKATGPGGVGADGQQGAGRSSGSGSGSGGEQQIVLDISDAPAAASSGEGQNKISNNVAAVV